MIKVTVVEWAMWGHPGVQWLNPYAIVSVQPYEFKQWRAKEWYDQASESSKESAAAEDARLVQIRATVRYAPGGKAWGTIGVAETPEQIAAMMAVACRPVQLES